MMSGLEVIFAWIAIGFAASIVGWIWPFRRGVAGIVLNVLVAVTGAVGLGLLGYFFGAYGKQFALTSMLFAAVGAIGATTLAHVVWARVVHPRPRGGH